MDQLELEGGAGFGAGGVAWAVQRAEPCAPHSARTSRRQFQIMIEFMEKEGDLCKLSLTSPRRAPAWERLRRLLNAAADSEGHSRSVDRWKKVWSDLKNNTKRKAMKMVRTPGAGAGTLSQAEYRVLKLMNMIKSSRPASAPAGGPAAGALRAVPKPTLVVVTPELQPLLSRGDFSPDRVDGSVDEEMFSWPKCPSPKPEELAPLEVRPPSAERAGPAADPGPGEAPEPGTPRPDVSGHTSARSAGGARRGRGPHAALRALLRAEARRLREERARRRERLRLRAAELQAQRHWRRLARRALGLAERWIARVSPAEAPEEAEGRGRAPLVLHPERVGLAVPAPAPAPAPCRAEPDRACSSDDAE